MRASAKDALVLTILTAALYGVSLGARDLWNPNEPIYGEAVREMKERGSWLVPYVNGLVFGEKPILYYWMALASSTLLGGVSELSLRIPSVLAGIGTVLGTYAIVLPYAGRRRAVVSAVVAATMYGVWWHARLVQMDILVTATTAGVILAVTRVVDHGAPAFRGWALAGMFAGLGFLAKGPVGWICPGLVLGVYLAATRRLRALVRIEVLVGAAVAIAVAAPWYLALAATGRTDVLHEVLIRQNFSRFSNPWDHAQPFWYFLENFWVDMAPWAFFVPLAWRLGRRDERERRLSVLAAAWIGTIVLFFSLSRSKRAPYILPIAPAVAILAAEVAVAYVEDRLTRRRRAAFLAIAGTLAVLLALAGVGLGLYTLFRHPELAAAARPVAAATLAGGLVVAMTVALRRLRRGIAVPAAVATAIVFVYCAASIVTLPALDAAKSARPFCEEVAKRAAPGDDLASFDFWNWRAEYAYYLGRPLRRISGAAELRQAWEGPRRLVLIVEEDRIAAAREVIGDAEPAHVRRIGSDVSYLFTNRPGTETPPPSEGPARPARDGGASGGPSAGSRK